MTISIPDHVLTQPLDEELILLNVETDLTYGLDPIAKAFWQEIESSNGDVGTIADRLMAAYDVDGPTLRADLDEFVTYLRGEGLIQVSE